jgi:hypothetical protein
MLRQLTKSVLREHIEQKVQEQIMALDASQYHLKKYRHVVEKLQSSTLEYIDDAKFTELKTIAEYVNDTNHMQIQRYEMLTLNAQEAMIKSKEPKAFIEEIKERCQILKSKASSVKAIAKKEDALDAVLEGSNPLSSVDELEALKNEIAHLANLSLGKKSNNVKTNFNDKVEDVRNVKTEFFVEKASVETAIQKVLNEYIDQLELIDEVQKKELISPEDIEELKHQVFEYEKLVEERLKEHTDFAVVMKEIMESSKKEIANKIFDNYIEAGTYTQKQIELMNRIKNILFGKKYATLEKSLEGLGDVLTSEHHEIANAFNQMAEKEQVVVYELMELLRSVDGGLQAA